MVDTGEGERVLDALEEVVEIPPPEVGRVEFREEVYGAVERFRQEPPEPRHYRFAVEAARLRDQDARSDVAVVVVEARGPGQLEGYRAHGAAPGAAGAGLASAGAGARFTAA